MALLCSTQSDVRVNFLGRLWHCVKIYLNASNKAPWPFSSYGSSEGVLNFDFHFVGNLRPNFQHNWKPLSTVHCILPRHWVEGYNVGLKGVSGNIIHYN